MVTNEQIKNLESTTEFTKQCRHTRILSKRQTLSKDSEVRLG